MKIRLLTDSSSDLPLSLVKENKEYLQVAGMPIIIGNEELTDDLGEEFSHDYFYGKLTEGVMPKTSQINTLVFLDIFRKNMEEGYSTVYIGLSSGLSGTVNNAGLAMDMMKEEGMDGQVAVVDSRGGSIGMGALVLYAMKLVKEGKTFEEVCELVESRKLRANHWFAVDNLMHLKNGGRIPAAAAYVGTVLSVKPILTMKHDGMLESYARVRGKKKAYKYLVSKAAEHKPSPDEVILLGHANIEGDAKILEDELRKQGINNPIIKTCLSATIASHVGPGMIAVAFMGDKVREEK